MQASRPSRATWMYLTSSKNGIASRGRWALRKRRWVCASISSMTASRWSPKRLSIHGEIFITGCGSGVLLKDQQRDDALHPGRAAFGIGRDDDVVRTGPVAVPPPAVD